MRHQAAENGHLAAQLVSSRAHKIHGNLKSRLVVILVLAWTPNARLHYPAVSSKILLQVPVMSKVCQVTGKRPVSGNNVSHAHNKTKRRFLPNLHDQRFWVASENRWVKLRVSTAGIRIINKKGIDTVLADMRSAGTKV